MRDMAAPESTRALYHLPAYTIVVRQSVKSATVTWTLEGSPPCSWESLLGEDSTSLKTLIPLLSCWSDHLSCSSQFVGLISSPLSPSWTMSLACRIHALKISRMVTSVTFYDLWFDSPKTCNVRMICNMTDPVCHGGVCSCVLCMLSEIIVSYFCGSCVCPSVVI